MTKSLTDQTLTSINWTLLSTYSKAGLTFFVGIILARILVPEDFGLLGMVTIFIGLAELFSTMGMGASIVKLKKINDFHKSIATYFTITSGFLIFGAFWFLTPIIANFYSEIRLISILRSLSILFIFKGIATISYSTLTRNLDFKNLMKIDVYSYFFGSVIISIVLASLGYGVWSLVFGRLSTSIISLFYTIKKVPLFLKVKFAKKEFNELFFFGTGISFLRVFQYIGGNIDYLIIGKLIDPYNLGLYQKSFSLMTQPMQKITGGIYNVLFPAYSKVQENIIKLKKGYFRTVQTIAFLLFPIFTIMIISGKYVILGLYGPKWENAISVFQILSLTGFVSATNRYSGTVANVTGKVFINVFIQMVYIVILGLGAYFAVMNGSGIEGVAYAVILALLFKFIIQSHIAIKIIESNWLEYLKIFIPGITFSIYIGFCVYVFQKMIELLNFEIHNSLVLLTIVFLSVVTFFTAILFFPHKLKGDTFNWLLSKYHKYFPLKFLSIYKKYNE